MGCCGDKVSPNHEPTAVRGCTDVFWLVLFILFWLLMIVVAIFSFVYGNPLRLINGYDSFGNTCGVQYNEKYSKFPLSGLNTVDKPYLFFLDMKHIRQTIKICVKECPKRQIENQNDLYKYYIDTDTKFCRYDFNMSLIVAPGESGVKYFDYLGPCPPFPIYEGSPVMHRCIPKGKSAPGKYVRDVYDLLNSWDIAQQLLSDLYNAWPFIALMSILSLLISIALITLMHWLTKIVSWIICVLVAVASIALCAILWWTYYSIRSEKGIQSKYSMLEEFIKNESAVYALAIIATIMMVILLVIIYFMRSKIGGLAALFEEAGNCMLSLPGLSIPPVLAFLMLAIFLAFWVTVVVCLATSNYPKMNSLVLLTDAGPLEQNNNAVSTEPIFKNNTNTNYKTFTNVEYIEAHWLRYMLWIYFIGLIWTSEFIFACQQLTLAGAVAYWYFRKPTDTPVIHAMAKLIKYHLGSVAKGSLLITALKVPRLIMTYLYAKLKKGEDKGSQCARCGLSCCICCFWFLEKFIRYLNHNAYTVIAIESINFCPAAGIAWNAMASNALQVATINGIGDFILFLGKLLVAVICGLVSVVMLKERDDMNFYIAPVILIVVFAFFIAHVVLSLYEIVVDTLFLCVCEDRTINGPMGRWKQSNLAKLVGEEPLAEEEIIQAVEMTPITKQPFSSAHIS